MRRKAIIFFISVILLFASVTVIYETDIYCDEYDAFNAAGMVLMDADNGRIVFEKDAQKKLPMASTTKIMTALLALERNDIYERFEVPLEAVGVEGSSMGLKAGDVTSLYDLSCGMLLSSGNDAADAAAIRISGSVRKFVESMNKKAKEIGMTNTCFGSPSGLDIGEHYSTAYDMALLAKYAFENERFAEICSRYEIDVDLGNDSGVKTLTNHNKLIRLYEWAKGGKTGYTKKAGRCLVSYAEKDGISLICVTLNCPDDWNVHKNIYDRYFEKLKLREFVLKENDISVPVVNGKEKSVTAFADNLAVALTDEEYEKTELKVYIEKYIFAPVKSEEKIGYAEITLSGEKIKRTDIKAYGDIEMSGHENSFSDWIYRLLNEMYL